ncbi:hypothetical protein [Edaphobacter sp. 12200R-103]|uniref:hypothetical protein n=1 Tax=Edaphobacter sp. 12200R-103 TaxID=2703788 RepID=UPI00138BC989|nr:hypothetical protein [Edaphobacter sp. 12200R-103]QHS51666.1 hypothetical protein GWR55_07865 [Edaphobacter sp. 12200R-103]
MSGLRWIRTTVVLLAVSLSCGAVAGAESCTTQSAMTETDRNALTAAVRNLADKVQNNDAAGLQAITIPQYANNFSAIQNAVATASSSVKGAVLVVEQVYLLDATDLKPGSDGKPGNAQFLCTLNHSIAEADFSIPSLPAGKYAFGIVEARGIPAPYRLSFLMQQEQGAWHMAGFYPRAMTAAGHDGLWYWTEARKMAKDKEQWSSWLYYQQAEALLNPTTMIQSTHLDKLRNEQAAAAPPALSDGIGENTPLVVKGADGVEYHFVGLSVDDSLAKEKVDVIARLKVDQLGDAATAKKRNTDAMSALVGAYPELRKNFHGVWMVAQAPGQNPYAIELAMNEIH